MTLKQSHLFDPRAASRRFPPASKEMLKLMLSGGLDPGIVAALLAGLGLQRQQLRYLSGPIILHTAAWADTLPAWIPAAIAVERLETVLAEYETGQACGELSRAAGDLATPLEVVAYLYPRTLAAPLTPEWQQVYLWCGQEALPRHNKLPPDRPLWQILDSDAPLLLSDYERREFLLPLQRRIRRKVVEHGRKLEQEARTEARQAGPQEPLPLFDQLQGAIDETHSD